jgi:hypothetical protein
MTKQTEFPNPPEGHVGLLCYDSGTDKWYAVLGDADGHIIIEVSEIALPTGAATSAKQDTMITALQLIDDLRNALGAVATDYLQVLVTSSALPTGAATSINQVSINTGVNNLLTELQLKADLSETQPVSAASLPLPTGAATSAKQDTMITALQLIDDLRNALGSVNTDDLQVDVKTAPTITVQSLGGDKLLAYESVAVSSTSDTNLSAGTNTLVSGTPASGKVWVITHISGAYKGTVPTQIAFRHHIGASSGILRMVQSPVSDLYYYIAGLWILTAGDTIDLQVWGATAGDDLFLYIAGYQMDAP